ncbi:MAG TPA: hypothetical protein VK400_16845 [Pyrinomonadaceae bacterium]|nr:hypothetical protein [Pyrinomonadaceae bacterium]
MKKIIQLAALFLAVGSLLVFETPSSEAKFGERGLRIFDDNQNGNSNRSDRNGNSGVNRNSNANGNSNGNSNFNGGNSNRGDDDGHRRGRRGRRGRGRD